MSASVHVLVLMETSREYGRGVLRGIERYARTKDAWMLDREPPFYLVGDRRRLLEESLRNRAYDGVICRDPDEVELLRKYRTPHILFSYRGQPDEDLYTVTTDDKGIGRLAAEYFLERGYRNFAWLGYDEMAWSKQRGESFTQRLRESGFGVDAFRRARSIRGRGWDKEAARVVEWLGSLEKPVAVFACNDDRAVQAATACRAAKLAVPDQVAILGVDDDEFVCNFFHPPLSSIRLNLEKTGYAAAAMLDHLMMHARGKLNPLEVQPTKVITRPSTDTIAVEDPEVARAIRFIRSRTGRQLRVADVVRETCLSRRALHERFKTALGRTVYEEIMAVRIHEIERLLLCTNLPVAEVAYQAGFSSPEHIAQFFRKHRGTTPSAFRKRHTTG